jgi:hypothetical protein
VGLFFGFPGQNFVWIPLHSIALIIVGEELKMRKPMNEEKGRRRK